MTTKPHAYTAAELLTILSARQLSDGQVVFAGIGIPLLAASLAQRRAPRLGIRPRSARRTARSRATPHIAFDCV